MSKTKRVHANVRQSAIMTELKRNGHASVSELAAWLGVTDMTIRRDLDQLDSQGIIERTHGGAKISGILQARAVELVEPALEDRARSATAEKRRIAREAIGLVNAESNIALDIGTTVYELAALIATPAPWILTGSLPIQRLLADRGINVAVPCGTLQGREPAIAGAQAVSYLQNLVFDQCFLGVAGLTVDGLSDYSLEDSEIKKTLIAQSKSRVVLADHTKFATVSTVLFSKFQAIDILITDQEPPVDLRDALEGAGVEIRVAAA